MQYLHAVLTCSTYMQHLHAALTCSAYVLYSLLATGSRDGSVAVWDAESGAAVARRQDAQNVVTWICHLPEPHIFLQVLILRLVMSTVTAHAFVCKGLMNAGGAEDHW
jgi:WD40 repeat protein